MEIVGLPSHALAGDHDLDRRLGELLAQAIPLVVSRAEPLRPRLLALMGSAASGEAIAVKIQATPRGLPQSPQQVALAQSASHRAPVQESLFTQEGPLAQNILPLSDLDLGLFVEAPAGTRDRVALQQFVTDETRTTASELGFLQNPIDVGIFPLFYLERMPVTLELGAVFRRPLVLWGDAGCLARFRQRAPRTFEAVRLMANRIVETFIDAGDLRSGAKDAGLSHRGAKDWLHAEDKPWPPSPTVDDWRAAHRWAKLVLDLAKARLAADGVFEPSVLRAAEQLAERWGSADAGSANAARELIRWSEWRARPFWPPPPRDHALPRMIARETLHAAARALGNTDFDVTSGANWRKLLRNEGGACRERTRRWVHLIRRRPANVSLPAASRYAAGWARHAWPASHAIASAAAAWLVSADATWLASTGETRLGSGDEASGMRKLFVRESPACHGLAVDRWDSAWSQALADWIEWARAAGV